MIVPREIIAQVFSFLFGAIVGSFANLCIYRLPRDLRITTPKSRCVDCGSAIAWYDNIPLVSYLVLRGRCRRCGKPFGVQHWLVEFFVALAGLWIYRNYGLHVSSVYLFVLTTALLIVSAIDFEHRIIPDAISLNGTWIGIFAAALASWLGWEWFVSFKGACIGASLGAGILWAVGWVYEKVTGREGIGFGDVKLLALFGANVGLIGVFAALLIGSFFGSLVGLSLMLFAGKGSRTPIPFGPYLCLGLLVYALVGQAVLWKLFLWPNYIPS